jgi:hypothetical protein
MKYVQRLRYVVLLFLFFLLSSAQESPFGVSLAWVKPSSSQPEPGFLIQTVSADFDGDHRSDLATGRREGQIYRVEIQFATGRNPASIVLPASNEATRIFALDIDCDNDQDLVVISAATSFPPVVWLNSDGGHFEEGGRWWWVTFLTNYNSSGFSSDNSRTEPIFLSEHQRSLFQSSATAQVATLEVRETLPWDSQTRFARILASSSSTRGPPLFASD